MARRTFLHVGTPKSGTTFLQSVWWANRAALREQGLLLPGQRVQEHFWASCVVRGHEPLLRTIPPEGHRAWERVLERTAAWDGDVLVSHELFSLAPAERAAAALRRLEAASEEVHVVVTARDLVRQVPAEWQQRTKHGRSQTFPAFVEEIRGSTTMNFWRVQDVAGVLERWGTGLPAERVHLVVLPPPGGPRTLVWDRTCALLGVDGSAMSAPEGTGNESLGLVEVETMRRLCAVLAEDGVTKSTERLLKGFVAEEVLRAGSAERTVLTPEAHAWACERAAAMVEAVAALGVDVVGDLDDLRPSPTPQAGRQPGDVTDAEIAAVAVRALGRFVRHEETRRSTGSRTTAVDAGARRARDLAGRAGRRTARVTARVRQAVARTVSPTRGER